jgi:outer membrane protein assembly factor BamB
LFGSTDNNVYALSSEAEELWRFEAGGPTSAPAVFDLFCDNKTEILFASKDGKVYALSSNGSLMWSYQTNGSVSSTPVAVNVNYRPELEVITASDDKNLYILDAEGNIVRSHIIADSFLSTICIGDVNLDGKPDYFMGAYNNKLDSIVSPENRRLAFDTGGSVPTPVYVPEGLDGRPRVIISSGDGRVYSLVYEEYTKIPEGNQNGVVKYSSMTKEWQYNLSGEVSASPAVSDLNADGFPEVIIGTNSKILYILDPEGKVLEKHSINGKILSSPVTADLDGDGLPEILMGSSDGLFHILNGSGFRKWSYETKSIITKSAAVSDLDRDGKAEILLTAGNKLYILGEKNNQPAGTTTTIPTVAPTTTTNIVTTTTEISTTTSSTTARIISTTGSTTTTTLNKEVANVGFNNFILFMIVLVVLFLAVGAAAKFLHQRFTKQKIAAPTLTRDKKDTYLQDQAAPKQQDPKIPHITPEETILKENKNVLSTLVEIMRLLLDAAAKFLDNRFIPKKNVTEKPVQVKKEASLQDLSPPKPPEPKSPLISSEEKTVNEYKEALNTLMKEEKNLPAVMHNENSLPALDEEHKEFLSDLKILEKEGRRKY